MNVNDVRERQTPFADKEGLYDDVRADLAGALKRNGFRRAATVAGALRKNR